MRNRFHGYEQAIGMVRNIVETVMFVERTRFFVDRVHHNRY